MSSFSRKNVTQKQSLTSLAGGRSSPLSASAELSTMTGQSLRTRTMSAFGSRPTTPMMVESRTVIRKEEWLTTARKSTDHFKLHGSPLPLVWVLTEGNQIPDNAVPFGEDRNGCTLYVARALLEGGLHIGKASPQFAGAVIGYAGKEHIIATYEVLVCASQLRWGFSPADQPQGLLNQGTVILAQQQRSQRTTGRTTIRDAEVDIINTTLVESDILRYVPESFQNTVTVTEDREVALKRLAEFKTVIIVDDSMSMEDGNLWAQAREALAGIVDVANQYGSRGADIHFMHQDDFASNMLIKSEVINLFNQISPEGMCEDTPTGFKLGQIINHYLPLLEEERSTHEPITILVITDGLPTDQADLERVIVDAAHRLDRRNIKHDMFGIQFVQIGTDPAASELLHMLDDHLVNQYRIRDMVDSTPYDPAHGAFDTEYMLKILLGGLHKDLDRSGSALMTTSTVTVSNNSPRGLSGRLGNSLNSPRLSTLMSPGRY